MKKKNVSLLSASLLIGAAPAALQAQSILMTGGTTDWTIQYDVDAGNFHVVFRDKGAVWNSDDGVLANNGLPGADAGNDYTFDTLTVRVDGQTTVEANTRNYFVSSIGSTGVGSLPTNPDLGIRTRLGHAFDNFTLTLNQANSNLPGDVGLFVSDGLGGYDFRLETAEGQLGSSAWVPQGHSHWHWGFTEVGNYTLAFNIGGDLTGGGTASGVTTVNFEVIPEPATVGIFLGLGVLGARLIVRRRK